jgi:hypothetical protein
MEAPWKDTPGLVARRGWHLVQGRERNFFRRAFIRNAANANQDFGNN